VVLAGSGSHAGVGRDGHHRLSHRLLPGAAHVPPHAGQRQHRVVGPATVLPDVVHHVGRDHLEAVRVAARRRAARALRRRLHLQDLGQWDLLEAGTRTRGMEPSSTLSSRTSALRERLLGFWCVGRVAQDPFKPMRSERSILTHQRRDSL